MPAQSVRAVKNVVGCAKPLKTYSTPLSPPLPLALSTMASKPLLPITLPSCAGITSGHSLNVLQNTVLAIRYSPNTPLMSRAMSSRKKNTSFPSLRPSINNSQIPNSLEVISVTGNVKKRPSSITTNPRSLTSKTTLSSLRSSFITTINTPQESNSETTTITSFDSSHYTINLIGNQDVCGCVLTRKMVWKNAK